MHGLIGLTTGEMRALTVQLGHPPYHGEQLARWTYRLSCDAFERMGNLPGDLRRALALQWRLRTTSVVAEVQAPDGAAKLLLQLDDAQRIECVYLPYTDRVSVCVSTQVGCPAGCRFCATGLSGFSRNLTIGEIVEQVLVMQSRHPNRRISHVVFMGMGEPLLNIDRTVGALRVLNSEVGISYRHITVSTVGIVPGIRRLALEDLPLNLAVSLHAPEDELRRQLIPTAAKWKLRDIIDECAAYRSRTGRDVTFEYVLLDAINDSCEHAAQLAKLLRGTPGVVNLIPYNPVGAGTSYQTPGPDRVRQFRSELEAAGRAVTQRKERGRRIAGACGQLRAERSAPIPATTRPSGRS